MKCLGSLGIDKMFGKGIHIPHRFLPPLLGEISKVLTKEKQIEQIYSAYQRGSEVVSHLATGA